MKKTITKIDDCYIGSSIERSEDDTLISGKGQFGDDIGHPPGTLHVAVLRSSYASGKIVNIDTSGALAIPGVHSIIDGKMFAEISKPLLSVLRVDIEVWPCAIEFVRYVGEPIALVLAKDRYIAEDAIENIKVSYKQLEPIIDTYKATLDDSPKVHNQLKTNVLSDREFCYGNPNQAFEKADKIVKLKIEYPRNSCTPLEGFIVQSNYNPESNQYTIQSNFQGPFSLHSVISRSLDIDENKLRLISNQDSGGSFGIKQAILPMMVLTSLASKISGKNIKWVEDRIEHLTAASSATNRVTNIRAAVKKNGKILALNYDQIDDVGAYLRAPEPASLYRMHGNLAGAYLIDNILCRNRVVVTNKTPTGLNRGFGGPQHYYALERLVHNIAVELNLDRLKVIKLNLVNDKDFPYQSASGALLDSGQYNKLIEKVLKSDQFKEIKIRQKKAIEEGDLYGIGYSAIVEPSISNMGYITTAVPFKEREKTGHKGGAITSASVTIGPTGGVYVTCDSIPQGQGHKTVLSQIVADVFGINIENILVNGELDTQKDAWSIAAGNYSSRFAGAVAGTTFLAAEKLKKRLLKIASSKLNSIEENIIFENNYVLDKNNSDNKISFNRLVGAAHWSPGNLPENCENGLRETIHWTPPQLSPPNNKDQINGSLAYGFVFDVCGLRINPMTGKTKIDRYITGHDAGKIINPLLANGQIYGAFAHGVGAALYEEFKYTADGSFLAGTFADYLLASTKEIITPTIIHIETPSPFTPLGSKGLGEGNCMSTPVAIANAACDALKLDNVTLPLTHSKVHGYTHINKTEKKRRKNNQGNFLNTTQSKNNLINGNGNYLIEQKRELVWTFLLDPKILSKTLPTYEDIKITDSCLYEGKIKINFGPITGEYHFSAQLTDLSKPESLRIIGRASGPLGIASGEGIVKLKSLNTNTTKLSYEYNINISGKIAAVGGRFLNTASKIIINQFFDRLNKAVSPKYEKSSLWYSFIKFLRKFK